jgi:cytochrome b561
MSSSTTSLRNSPDRYGLIARLFHGAMVLTIGANLVLGLLFDDAIEPDEGGRFAALHATLGILTLLLLVGRVLWRFIDPPPPITVGTPIERSVAHAGHIGLYALAVVVSFSGWVVASHECERIDLIGGMTLPRLAASGAPAPAAEIGACEGEAPTLGAAPAATPALAGDDDDEAAERAMRANQGESDEVWEEVHELGSWALLALILLHAGAALMHRKRKDGTWERMFG